MVKLLLGGKGAGKTKEMIAFANDKVEVKKGDIVFINKNDRLNFDLKYDIRLISMIEYPYIENIDGFIGFLYGIQSGNSDIESVYIDGILKYADINTENIHMFLERLNILSENSNIEFNVSLSAEKGELEKVNFDAYEIL